MTFGVSIFLGAVGAILRYAVADEVDGADLRTIGLILMIDGAVGLRRCLQGCVNQVGEHRAQRAPAGLVTDEGEQLAVRTEAAAREVDLGEHVILLDGVALLHVPLDELALHHAFTEIGQLEFEESHGGTGPSLVR